MACEEEDVDGEQGGDDMTEEEGGDGDDEEEVWLSRRLRGPASASLYLGTGHKEMDHGDRITLFTTEGISSVQRVLLIVI